MIQWTIELGSHDDAAEDWNSYRQIVEYSIEIEHGLDGIHVRMNRLVRHRRTVYPDRIPVMMSQSEVARVSSEEQQPVQHQ